MVLGTVACKTQPSGYAKEKKKEEKNESEKSLEVSGSLSLVGVVSRNFSQWEMRA